MAVRREIRGERTDSTNAYQKTAQIGKADGESHTATTAITLSVGAEVAGCSITAARTPT